MNNMILMMCLTMATVCDSAERVLSKKEQKIDEESIVDKMQELNFVTCQEPLGDKDVIAKAEKLRYDIPGLLELVKQHPVLREERIKAPQSIIDIVVLENPSQIPAFLDAGVPVDQRDNEEKTALIQLATYRKTPEKVRSLLDNKARIDVTDKHDCNAIMYALSYDKGSDVFNELIHHPSFPPLVNRVVGLPYAEKGKKSTYLRAMLQKNRYWCLDRDRNRMLKRLLDVGAEVGVDDVLLGHDVYKDLYDMLLQYCSPEVRAAVPAALAKQNALHEASVISLCHDAKLSSAEKKQTIDDASIMDQVRKFDSDMPGLLSLVKQYPVLRQERIEDFYPIIYRVVLRDPLQIPAFLAAGVPINQRTYVENKTALMELICSDSPKKVRSLLESKALVEPVDKHGCDAVMYALRYNRGGASAEELIKHPSFSPLVNRMVTVAYSTPSRQSTYLRQTLNNDRHWYSFRDRIVKKLLEAGAKVGVDDVLLGHDADKDLYALLLQYSSPEVRAVVPAALAKHIEAKEAAAKK